MPGKLELQLLRGTEAQRTNLFALKEGQPLYITDTNKLYIGRKNQGNQLIPANQLSPIVCEELSGTQLYLTSPNSIGFRNNSSASNFADIESGKFTGAGDFIFKSTGNLTLLTDVDQYLKFDNTTTDDKDISLYNNLGAINLSSLGDIGVDSFNGGVSITVGYSSDTLNRINFKKFDDASHDNSSSMVSLFYVGDTNHIQGNGNLTLYTTTSGGPSINLLPGTSKLSLKASTSRYIELSQATYGDYTFTDLLGSGHTRLRSGNGYDLFIAGRDNQYLGITQGGIIPGGDYLYATDDTASGTINYRLNSLEAKKLFKHHIHMWKIDTDNICHVYFDIYSNRESQYNMNDLLSYLYENSTSKHFVVTGAYYQGSTNYTRTFYVVTYIQGMPDNKVAVHYASTVDQLDRFGSYSFTPTDISDYVFQVL